MSDDVALKKMVTRDEKRSFRFWDSIRYPSEYEVDIPIKVGSGETTLKVSVVIANIPLLIGLSDFQKLELEFDFGNMTAKSKTTGEIITLEKTRQDHVSLPIIAPSVEEDGIKATFFTALTLFLA